MEQLSRANYARATERNEYLRKLLGEHDSDSSRVSDSDDEDWIPANRARHQNQKGNSVRGEPEGSEDTEEIAEENSAVEEEEEIESSESEDDDN
nr:microfibrillar-associated protein 1-like [Bactrocera oleae]